ncbi:hypothetical protein ALP61_200096 [Pseudomonas savastanoi]|nr:hypothetical protein ALP61_200096 [Pseudomonas savastanoi]
MVFIRIHWVRAFFDYGTYMEGLGLKPLLSELKIIPE